MMTLYQLKKIAQECFPNERIDLVRLLLAWASNDTEGELGSILGYTGINIETINTILLPFSNESSADDDELLTSCLLLRTDGPILGAHILKSVAEAPRNRVHIALQKAGCDFELFKRNIAESLSQKKGTLAAQGIKVTQLANPLLKYGRDLTTLAAEHEFDSLCDRPEEIDRLVEVLLRKQKGNPALTGPAGVGKTALVELFARCIIRKAVPSQLYDTHLFEVSMGRLVAGTRYRGDFEERMEEVIKAVSERQPAVLFIDEMHLIWGAGRAEGVITDAANILKPFLSRGTIRLIGATTVEEYNRYITQDSALARRFQEIRLEEPDKVLTRSMVVSQAEGLSEFHSIAIGPDIIDEAMALTDKYVPARFQPDKSIDLLDTCCVNAKKLGKSEITKDDLKDTIARQTGTQISSITDNIRSKLAGLASALKTKIVGQDEAIDRVVSTYIQRRQGLGHDEKNLGSFLFAGQTGVGKTELARSIAEIFFGKRNSLLKLDLAEYNQAGSVNKLVGSPAGYMGSEKEGVLTDWMHTTGTGVILFDEIEKSHQDIHRLILGLLDTGRIASSKGEMLDARQCIIILTTNAIKQQDLNRENIGFFKSAEKPVVEDILEEHFPRELLSRLDEQILFGSLSERNMKTIVLMRLAEALERSAKQGIIVSFDEETLSLHLLSLLKKDKTGARGIARIIEKQILQPISLALLQQKDEGEVSILLGEKFIRDGIVELANIDGD
jgi:ATP-dependent Clp protease ATP-binding subunit ClpC